jgi:hypothetical protein
MPRFYFDVRQDGDLTPDEEGEELPDADAAEQEAALAAIHLVKELLHGPQASLAVEVRDEQGTRVARATVTLDVDR